VTDAKRSAIVLGSGADAGLGAELARRCQLFGPFDAPLADSIASLAAGERGRVCAIVVRGSVHVPRATMATLPSLRLISCIGSGFEGIDRGAAADLGITVTHSPGANASSVADLAFGLVLGVTHRIFEANTRIRSSEWPHPGRQHGLLSIGLTHRRMGIFGLGAIGTKIAQRAAAFEMEVGYCNRQRRTDVDYAYFPSPLELARWADVLVIAVRGSSDNRRAINRDVLTALGSRGYLVNIARGSVVDEEALLDALRDGTIAGAGLDVFENEPQINGPLVALPNVLATPHMAGNTEHSWASMQRMVLANVDALLAGTPFPDPVPSSQGHRRPVD
jgi:lactate dehydrogenase-like 2-hydroxyacid dehydrogenase